GGSLGRAGRGECRVRRAGRPRPRARGGARTHDTHGPRHQPHPVRWPGGARHLRRGTGLEGIRPHGTTASARSPHPGPRAAHERGDSGMSDAIRINLATTRKARPKDSELTFGTVFTDHMFVCDFQEEKGWYDPRVEPYGPLSLEPACAVLHYAQAVFDGLKAFRGRDGKIRLFRPQKHVERLNRSAEGLCIPPVDPDLSLRALVTLVGVDRDWVPGTMGTSLYIRPTIIASEPFLGV